MNNPHISTKQKVAVRALFAGRTPYILLRKLVNKSGKSVIKSAK
jgi:hypothetical protein